jgi:hypothetical protein
MLILVSPVIHVVVMMNLGLWVVLVISSHLLLVLMAGVVMSMVGMRVVCMVTMVSMLMVVVADRWVCHHVPTIMIVFIVIGGIMRRLHGVLVPVSWLWWLKVPAIGFVVRGVSIALIVPSLLWNFDFRAISVCFVSVMDLTCTFVLRSSQWVEFADVYSGGNIEIKFFSKARLGCLRRLWRATVPGYMVVIYDGLLG